MPRQFSSDWYYEQIVKDAIENPNNRTFTISHVPKEQKADVIKLLKNNYGGNSSDKKLGEAVQKVAAVIPAAAGAIATLPQTTMLLLSAMKNPKF